MKCQRLPCVLWLRGYSLYILKLHNLKTTTTHPWASACRKTILTSAKVNVTRLPSHVCRCHVWALSRTAVVVLGEYVAALISGLWFVAFGEELRWLKKSSVLFSRNLIFCFIAYWRWCLKKQKKPMLYKLISKLRNKYDLSKI